MKKKVKTKKEIEQKVFELNNISFMPCVTQSMCVLIQKATLEWVLGERETLDLHFDLVE